MSTIHGRSPIIDSYLAELDASTAGFAPDERYEIRSSIEDHLVDLIGGRSSLDDAEARRIVDHLGPVSEITRAVPIDDATRTLATTAPAAETVSTTSAREHGYARLALIMAGVTIAAFVLIAPLALITGIVAVVFGVLGLRAGERRGESWAGILVGSLPLALLALWLPLGMNLRSGSASIFGI